jgi:FkbM family methyltransferase
VRNRIGKALRALQRGLGSACRRFVLRLRGEDIARLRNTGVRIRVDPGTLFGRELLQHGERPTEAFMIPLLKEILRPGDAFLDVGAHWGTYSLVAAELVGITGRVIAIEPFPDSFRLLRANARLNRRQNLTVLRVAAGDRETTGFLISPAPGDNLATFQQTRPSRHWHCLPKVLKRALGLPIAVSCRMTTLECILNEQAVSEIAAMKMDIEGSECLAFHGLLPLRQRIRFMLVELHPPFAGFNCDVGLLYRVLAEERELFLVDGSSGQLLPIVNRREFENHLGGYYFFSARAGVPPNLAAGLELKQK